VTDPVRRIRANELSDGPVTPGMQRLEAFATDRLWSGLVHTEAGAFSAWHHHGDHESVIYVVSGGLRLESGAGGEDVVDAVPGEFIYIPPYTVHREGNTTPAVASIVVTRSGTGEAVVNVDGPEDAGGQRPSSRSSS
jgi:uncharacterized RmlC-like cupin family protein